MKKIQVNNMYDSSQYPESGMYDASDMIVFVNKQDLYVVHIGTPAHVIPIIEKQFGTERKQSGISEQFVLDVIKTTISTTLNNK